MQLSWCYSCKQKANKHLMAAGIWNATVPWKRPLPHFIETLGEKGGAQLGNSTICPFSQIQLSSFISPLPVSAFRSPQQPDEKSLKQFTSSFAGTASSVQQQSEKAWWKTLAREELDFEDFNGFMYALVINNLNKLEMINSLRDNLSYIGQQRNRMLILGNYLPQNLFINYLH